MRAGGPGARQPTAQTGAPRPPAVAPAPAVSPAAVGGPAVAVGVSAVLAGFSGPAVGGGGRCSVTGGGPGVALRAPAPRGIRRDAERDAHSEPDADSQREVAHRDSDAGPERHADPDAAGQARVGLVGRVVLPVRVVLVHGSTLRGGPGRGIPRTVDTFSAGGWSASPPHCRWQGRRWGDGRCARAVRSRNAGVVPRRVRQSDARADRRVGGDLARQARARRRADRFGQDFVGLPLGDRPRLP